MISNILARILGIIYSKKIPIMSNHKKKCFCCSINKKSDSHKNIYFGCKCFKRIRTLLSSAFLKNERTILDNVNIHFYYSDSFSFDRFPSSFCPQKMTEKFKN